MRIVVKIGTQSILDDNGSPIEKVFHSLISQMAALQSQGHKIILVSSGAVGTGRNVAGRILNRKYGGSIGEKQLLAALGQPQLMRVYTDLFAEKGIAIAQILLTKQDFKTRRNYLNIMRLLNEILANKGIIPIINENDSVAVEELMFTDNDELSGLIAAQIGADKLIILSNVAGVYTGNPNEKGSEIIPVIDPKTGWPTVSTDKSAHGRGGMMSKLDTARTASNLGITTHIAYAARPDVITDIVAGTPVGTTIMPERRKSNIKRWMAHSANETVGTITVNKCLGERLKDRQQATSILPVGIIEADGEFKKGDTVRIVSANNDTIGIGLARYGVKELKEHIGEKNRPEFIHCNYLYIF